MSRAATPAPDRSSPARQRVLDAAARLFYAEGIHAVGVDRIIAEAAVTKATFYRHFPAKDELVRVYVDGEDQRMRAAVADLIAERKPVDAITAIFDAIGAGLAAPGFRGSPFANTAAEYPDLDHPVGQAIRGHRAWLRETLVELLTAAGDADATARADMLVLARDGAMSAGHLDGGAPARIALGRVVDVLLAEVRRA